MTRSTRRRGWSLACIGLLSAVPIAACGDDQASGRCTWTPAEREAASARYDSWRADLSEVARSAIDNRESHLYDSYTEADLSAILQSDPCLIREVRLPGLFLRVTELSGPENVRSYLDNDSIAASSKYSQLLPTVDAGPSAFPTDAEASWYCQGEVTSCPGFSVVVQVRSCAGLVVEGKYYEDNDTNERAAREHLTRAIAATLEWAEAHHDTCGPATYPLHVFDP